MERKPRIELKCTECGETNPSQFEICWNCGRSLQDAERVETYRPVARNPKHETESASSQFVSDRRSHWLELIAVLLVTCVTETLWLLRGSQSTPDEEAVFQRLIWLPYQIGWIILLRLLIHRDKSVQQPVAWRKLVWWRELMFGLLIMLTGWMLSGFVRYFAGELGMPDGAEQEAESHSTWPLLALQCVLMLVPAAYEEMLFRVYVQSRLQSLLGGRVLWSILISAAIFAVWHCYPLRSTFVLFVWAVFMGTIYQQTHRLPRLVLAHWLHNMWLACIPLLRVG